MNLIRFRHILPAIVFAYFSREPAGLSYSDFTGASLIDCCGTAPEQHGVLLLQNGRIVTIVTEEEIGIPKRQP